MHGSCSSEKVKEGKWYQRARCPNCKQSHAHTIGNDDDFKAFSSKDTIFDCPHCKEKFMIYYHPCYFCGKLGSNKHSDGSDGYDIYMCNTHLSEFHTLSNVASQEFFNKVDHKTTLLEDCDNIRYTGKETIKNILNSIKGVTLNNVKI